MNTYYYALCGLLLLIAAIAVAAFLCRKAAEKYEGLDGVYHKPSRGSDVHFRRVKVHAMHPAVKKAHSASFYNTGEKECAIVPLNGEEQASGEDNTETGTPLEPGPAPAPEKAPKPEKEERGALTVAKDIGFYLLIVLLLVLLFLTRARSDGSPNGIGGYYGMIVLSGSMEDVIPVGSLVIARHVDPQTLEIGDDITYMANQTTSVTHRIIGITEDYEGTGQRGFETKGTMNKEADSRIVMAANVVGIVVFHSLILGKAATFVNSQWPYLLFVMGVLFITLLVLERIYRRQETPPEAPAEQAPPQPEEAAPAPAEPAEETKPESTPSTADPAPQEEKTSRPRKKGNGKKHG